MAEKEKEAKYMVLDQADTDSMKALAVELRKFIMDNKLYTNVQGKEFVNVEGWMYAGSRLGLTSYTEDVWDISTADEIKYKAQVVIVRLEDGMKVGQGFAVCSNKEQGKKYYQEYAIMSMAQTRGLGKGYRMFLAQLIRMAGFEPTPAEEMDGYDSNRPEPAKPAPAKAAKGTAEQAAPTAPAPEQEAPAAGVTYATAKQKEKIIELLNNPVITRQEKTKMLLNINRLDTGRAAEVTNKLKAVIEEREEAAANLPN